MNKLSKKNNSVISTFVMFYLLFQFFKLQQQCLKEITMNLLILTHGRLQNF